MKDSPSPLLKIRSGAPPGALTDHGTDATTILSFDAEEHFRIEAAAGLALDPTLKARYRERLAPSTYWLLDQLDRRGIKATFFVLGQIARHHPTLVRAIHRAGHLADGQ